MLAHSSRLLRIRPCSAVWRRPKLAGAAGEPGTSWSAEDRAPAGTAAWTGNHRIDLRASIPLPGGRWYFTLVAGPERRNRERLADEGQTGVARRAAVYALLLSIMCWVAVLVLLLVYAIKSVLGIDVLDGPSPLHTVLETWIER